MEKKLEVKNLQVSFRTQGGIVRAVRDISFDLYKGETLAIVGESGSGKSVTSKAIIGILAGNSIVEGGEILYDGQDLLKISEDYFHEIRGDKISMIFQDPMSSLNPIMRVGQQLTEAMILNGKARQKNAKKDFNEKLSLLNHNLDEVNENKDYNKAQCTVFDSFCIESTKYELEYNDAHAEAISLQSDIENYLFLIEKRQKLDLIKVLKEVREAFKKSIHVYVVKNDDRVADAINTINEQIKLGKKAINVNDVVYLFNKINDLLVEGINRNKPNFFRLGFYKYKNPTVDVSAMDVNQLDEMTKSYLDENFMTKFIELGSLGVKNSHDKSIKAKKEILESSKSVLGYFAQENIEKSVSKQIINDLSKNVEDAIDKLSIHRKGFEYSFAASIKHAVNTYLKGIKNNPKMIRKYEAQKRKYDSLVASGKQPTWKVTPALTVDLELAKNNISKILETLFETYRQEIANDINFNAKEEMIALVDYFKELASRVVYKVTHKLAKARALELLEEVGIPEPALRYKQYPFEFSGGMRQRIVIAIALSANPDILICDEPTTALDVTIQSQILELINRIKEERNLSVIFITHDLGVVANMADRIAVMYAGKIVEVGTSNDVFYDPKHPYTWALLSSMPDLDTKEKLEAIPGTPPNMIYPPKGDAFAERNKYALEIDFEMEPPMFKVSDTHYAATWLLHPDAPSVNPPKIVTDRIERMKKGGKQ